MRGSLGVEGGLAWVLESLQDAGGGREGTGKGTDCKAWHLLPGEPVPWPVGWTVVPACQPVTRRGGV